MIFPRHFALFAIPLAVIGLATAPARGEEKGAETRRPNVILLLQDTLRADHLGCYGFPGPTSPAIDAFAAEAVLFERAVTTSPWTKPAIASLFTSLYPETHGLVNSRWPPVPDEAVSSEVLPSTLETIAERFQAAGYRTKAVVSNVWMRDPYGFSQGFEEYEFCERYHTTSRANDWIVKNATAAPFFLYVHLMDTHGPYEYTDEDFSAMISHVTVPVGAAPFKPGATHYMFDTFHEHPERADDLRNWRAAYAAAVRENDRSIASILAALKAAGAYDNSIVVLTSDHGEGLMDHGEMDHGGNVNIEEIHIPLIVRLPGGARGGRRVRAWAGLIDLLPTFNDLCDLGARDRRWRGRSLRPAFGRKDRLKDRRMYSGTTSRKPEKQSVVEKKNHFILAHQPESAFYDLLSDPTETTNLVTPKIRRRFSRLINRHLSEALGDRRVIPDQAPMTKELQEQLRSLGYLQ